MNNGMARTGYLGVLCLLAAMAGGVLAAEPVVPMPPDLTQGGKKDNLHDWFLGPTGARGWIFFRGEDQTAAARQILITAVEAGSPADGVLTTNDVILGVGGKPFADDPRKSFGRAITAAEEKTGVLRLIRWRDGTTANIELKLSVLGAYGDTAPYDSPKSKAIFEQGCALIARQGLKETNLATVFNALALLASGKAEYQPMLTNYVRKVASSLSLSPRSGCWWYAYANLFLAEYILDTGDRSLLPELQRTALEAAKAQCMNGMWGHHPPLPDGHSEGYGGMNQVGLPMTIGLVLARKAGVDDPAVDQAIAQSVRLLRWFSGKGAIPYGDHGPWMSHEDNGKCSSATVLFDLLGDREAASFFARMATAAYEEREGGHGGNLWNMLWALPAVSRCGPLATSAYLKEHGWYYELARTWKGGFIYQWTDDPNNQYKGWDLTGAYLLSCALPCKSLYITGKQPSVVKPLKAREVTEVIAAGRDFYPGNKLNGYNQRTTEALLAGLSSWSPAVRARSAKALGNKEGNFVPALLKLLAGSDHVGRYGAIECLGGLGPRADPAVVPLRAALQDTDPWMNSLACQAILQLSPEVRKTCINDLLELAARQNPADPRCMAQRAVGFTLFSSPPGSRAPTILNYSLEGVDRKLLYPAIRLMLQNEVGATRGSISRYLTKLTDRDLAVLLPDIIEAVKTMSPSDEMFADGIRCAGLDLLSSRHIREGMNLCASTIEMRWGLNGEKRLEYLKRYGVHAQENLPLLRKECTAWKWQPGLKAIAEIEASTNAPTLVSLQEFVAQAQASKQ